ncbi:hypothetical protein A2G06_16635 (plasmid) [Geobacter anodireducens]|nr:hypothetical protein A2G06_16635 [Geobacter anodireducens]
MYPTLRPGGLQREGLPAKIMIWPPQEPSGLRASSWYMDSSIVISISPPGGVAWLKHELAEHCIVSV